MRKRIYEIIEKPKEGDKLSTAYDIFMLVVIVCSLLPLVFKKSILIFDYVDHITVVIFILDYLLRMVTADYKLKKGNVSFVLYPFTPLAIIDLVCILPSFSVIGSGFKILKVIRLFRTFRVFRTFKLFRYSKSVDIIVNVIRRQSTSLLTVCGLAAGYVLISALVVFNIEPETFNSFFDAIYWAAVSLTTVGYGDIYPVSTAGRVVTMISSFIGIAIVALPAGIITAGYMQEIQNNQGDNK